MPLIRSHMTKTIAAAGAVAALGVPMAAQADAATTTVRLHAATATGESLQGPGSSGFTVSLAPTSSTAATQKWQKTTLAFGFASYKLVSSVGTNREICLASNVSSFRPFAALCNPGNTGQQWTRGFVNDGRIENRLSRKSLTRVPTGGVELRFRAGGQVGQNWHEHPVS